jgi:AcrR family transcriptional regulator
MPYPHKLSEQKIVSEASSLVDEVGLDALTTRALALRLNARAPSLYRYFPDKESLVRALAVKFGRDLAEHVGQHETWADMAHAYWDFALRYANRYAVLVDDPLPGLEAPPADKFRVTEPLHELASRVDPERQLLIARVLWSYLHGAVNLNLNWPTRTGLDPASAFNEGVEALQQWLDQIAVG